MTKPTSVGIHVYAGGFACGLADSFTQVGALEECFGDGKSAATFGTDTFHMNFPSVEQRNAAYKQPVEEAWRSSEFRGVNLAFGNPPCSAFSVVGSRKYMNDPVLGFTYNTIDAGLAMEPDIFVWECVPNIWGKGRAIIDEAAAMWSGRGYQINVFFTNWVMHGAPTSRERFHFIATRYEIPFRDHTPNPSVEDIITAREAIEDLETHPWDREFNHVWLPEYDEKAQNVMNLLHEGEAWVDGYERAIKLGLIARKHRLVAGRLRYDAPSRTLLDIGAVVHPRLNRPLTVREGARLCGYPDDFIFKPTSDPYKRMTEVTKAVIPPAGRFLGKIFAEALENGKRVTSDGTIHLTDWRAIGRPFTPGRYYKKWIQPLEARTV